jgi:FkbM family methyltransferase
MPRHASGMIRLAGTDWRYLDYASFAAQFRSIFVEHQYAFRREEVERLPRILDCGSNIGVSAIWFARTCPSAAITCFEPDPALCRCLAANLTAAGLRERVAVVDAAVWHRAEDQVRFTPDGADGGHISPEGHASVRTVRLADYLVEPVGLLKMDIEGAELDVLLDCAGGLRHVSQLILEYHSMTGRPQRLGECLSLLESSGFRVSVDAAPGWINPLVRNSTDQRLEELSIVYGHRRSKDPAANGPGDHPVCG